MNKIVKGCSKTKKLWNKQIYKMLRLGKKKKNTNSNVRVSKQIISLQKFKLFNFETIFKNDCPLSGIFVVMDFKSSIALFLIYSSFPILRWVSILLSCLSTFHFETMFEIGPLLSQVIPASLRQLTINP